MQISIWSIGKTQEKYLKEGVDKYLKRLSHYTKIYYEEWKDVKPGVTPEKTTKREAEMILTKLKTDDILIILDEKGKEFTSIGLAGFLEKLQIQSSKNIVMLIGGAYGHHELIRDRSQYALSLSKMTFSHQMVRLFLVEQVYRAFTIIRNEKYHNV